MGNCRPVEDNLFTDPTLRNQWTGMTSIFDADLSALSCCNVHLRTYLGIDAASHLTGVIRICKPARSNKCDESKR